MVCREKEKEWKYIINVYEYNFIKSMVVHKDKICTHVAYLNINLYFDIIFLTGFYYYFFRINFVLKTVQSYGDYEKLSQGIFENFLSLKHKDSSLSNVCVLQHFAISNVV